MRLNKTDVVEINLRDLFFNILYHWRSILAAALAGALLLGGYAFLSNRNRSAQNTGNAVKEQTGNSVRSNYGMSNRVYEQLLEESTDYCENAVSMKTDPFRGWFAEAVYAVVAERTGTEQAGAADPSVMIAKAYPLLVPGMADADELKNIFGGAGAEYIREVIWTGAVADSESNISQTGTGNGVYWPTNSFRIGITAPERETAEKALAYIESALEEVSKGEIQQMGAHRLVKLSHSVSQTVSDKLLLRQENTAKRIAAWQKAITDNNTAINKAPASSGSAGGRKSVKKFALLGILLGLVASCGIWFVVYVTAGKLRSGETLKNRIGIPVLGELRHLKGRSPGKGIDGLIGRWEYRRNPADNGAVIDNICALIRERRGDGPVLLTGTIPGDRISELCKNLTERLGDTVELRSEGDFQTNSRAITEAAGAAAVILAEEKDVSRIPQIDSMAEKLMISGASVIGAVVL